MKIYCKVNQIKAYNRTRGKAVHY